MTTNPEFAHSVETESPYYHPELHAERPDQRDVGVDQWWRYRDKLDQYDPAELLVTKEELEEIPEVANNDQERVNLDSINDLLSQAADLTPEANRHKLAKTELTYPDLVRQLEGLIDQYTDTVRRYEHLKILKYQDPEKYLKGFENADKARHYSHEALMGHLQAMSRLLHGLPKQAGQGFDDDGWRDVIQRRWFSHGQLTTSKGREDITEWAVRMDIVRKARAVEDAIDQVLERKKADGASAQTSA